MTNPTNTVSVRVSLILVVMALVLTVAFAWLWIINLDTSVLLAFGNRSTPLVLTASGIVFVVVGAMVTSRRPGNKVGWVALGIGLPAIISTFVNEYAIYSTVTEPGSLPGGRSSHGWETSSGWRLSACWGQCLCCSTPTGILPPGDGRASWRAPCSPRASGYG